MGILERNMESTIMLLLMADVLQHAELLQSFSYNDAALSKGFINLTGTLCKRKFALS